MSYLENVIHLFNKVILFNFFNVRNLLIYMICFKQLPLFIVTIVIHKTFLNIMIYQYFL